MIKEPYPDHQASVITITAKEVISPSRDHSEVIVITYTK